MLVRVSCAVRRLIANVLDRILLVDYKTPIEPTVIYPNPDESDPAHLTAVGATTRPGDDAQSLDGHVHVMRRYSDLQLCIARPRNIEEAEQVGERLKRRMPVILNLESTDEAMAQRIADYMSGAVHMVDARIAKGGRMVWVYAPVDMEVEILRLEQDQPKAHLFADEGPAFLRDTATGGR